MDIARRALSAQQVGLNVTGHNIANVNTEGYARQRVVLEATPPLRAGQDLLGTGVDVQTIERIRDRFYDSEIRLEKNALGRWEYRERVFSEIESIFNEPSDSGLSEILNDFWDGWGELANDPQRGSAREQVKQMGIQLASTFNHLHNRLIDLQSNLDEELKFLVTEVNSILHQITDLNEKIAQSESSGVVANEYRDRRDLLLENLSDLVDAKVSESENGMVTVSLGGRILVERGNVYELGTRDRSLEYLVVKEPTLVLEGEAITITDGKLKGLMELRDEVISEQLEKLDALAMAIVSEVNGIHSLGYGQDGSTGNHFFDSATTGANNIALDAFVLADVSKIAGSGDGSPGDGSIALQISQLRNETIMSGETVTVDDFFAAMMGTLGVQSKEASFMRKNQELMVQQLENHRSSISGVSLDEEMTNLIRYQHAYEAAAHLITTVDEMMQTILDLV